MSYQYKVQSVAPPSCLKGASIKSTEVCAPVSKTVCGTVHTECPREAVVTKCDLSTGTVHAEQIQSKCQDVCRNTVVVEETAVKCAEEIPKCSQPCRESIVKTESLCRNICEPPLQTVVRRTPCQSVHEIPCQGQASIPVYLKPCQTKTYVSLPVQCDCGHTVVLPRNHCVSPVSHESIRLVSHHAQPLALEVSSPGCGCTTCTHSHPA